MKRRKFVEKLGLGSAGRVCPVLPLVVLLAAGCTSRPAPAQPTSVGVPQESAAAIVPPGDGAAAIAAVRNATAAFHDLDKAIAAGYELHVGEPCVVSPTGAGTMGVHLPNPALLASLPLEPTQPELLLYIPTNGGGFGLVAVEYLQAVLLRDTTTGAVAPWFASTPWPPTYVVVNPAPSLFGQTFQGPMGPHAPGMPWHYDLHVWAWAPNPSGTFAQWNPAISCP